MRNYSIAVIPGDGIGKDVIDVGLAAMRRAQEVCGDFEIEFETFPWSCAHYLEYGQMMPENAIDTLRQFDAIYLGAVGFPSLVPDHISLWGLLLPIRKEFDLYVNQRPARLLPGLAGPLRDKTSDDINFVCLRENTEGGYSGVGGRVHRTTDHEVAVESMIFTRRGVERIIRYAFQLARHEGRKRVTSVTKSNAMGHSMVFWDEVFEFVASEFDDIQSDKIHVDAMTARMVRFPEQLDVVVAENLFGDILTDLAAAIQGSMGLAASANINPDRTTPSLFEPVHGSAPDIAGKGIANPIASVWAASMMLDFLGERDAGRLIMGGIETLTAEGRVLTSDIGGAATTSQVGEELVRLIGSAAVAR
jgi:tartrate dehydrogenase/decarboxylase / D-malate dehydrogenase